MWLQSHKKKQKKNIKKGISSKRAALGPSVDGPVKRTGILRRMVTTVEGLGRPMSATKRRVRGTPPKNFLGSGSWSGPTESWNSLRLDYLPSHHTGGTRE